MDSGIYFIEDLNIEVYSRKENTPLLALMKIYELSDKKWLDIGVYKFLNKMLECKNFTTNKQNTANYYYILNFKNKKIKSYKINYFTKKRTQFNAYTEAKKQLDVLKLYYNDFELKEYIEMLNSLDKKMFY